MKKYKAGLAVMRMQPMHIGHESLIHQMQDECEVVIIMLGSANAPRSDKNPFTVSERMKMVRNVFGDSVLLGAIPNLGNINLWAGYVLATVWKKFHIEPDAYFCGNESDGLRFAAAGLKLVNIDRSVINICATEIRRNPSQNISYINERNRQMVLNFFNQKCY